MIKDYKNCCLTFENDLTALTVSVEDSVPKIRSIVNKKSGFRWEGNDSPALITVPGYDFAGSSVRYAETADDRRGLSAEARLITLSFSKEGQEAVLSFRMYPDNPFITMSVTLKGRFGADVQAAGEKADGVEKRRNAADGMPEEALFMCPVSEKHLKLASAELHDVTDVCDTLVTEQESNVYPYCPSKHRGHVFRLTSYLIGETLMLVKEAPCRAGRLYDGGNDLTVAPGHFVRVEGFGLDLTSARDFDGLESLYTVSFAAAGENEILEKWRSFYRRDCEMILKDGLYLMSNTWGDRSRDAAVCEDFMLAELDCAEKLGVTAVQIDDGWQTGVTANAKYVNNGAWGEGLYKLTPDFWVLNRDKFPHGLSPVVEKANRAGIRMGLWFSPDQTDNYIYYQKDAGILTGLQKEYGIDFFKVDSVNIRSETTDRRLLAMLDRVHEESGGRVVINFDITGGRRWGYFRHREYGSLFVENRYTDWGNYYPHRTLRNLWMLSRYVPAARLQMEFLNPRRNTAVYGDDPFRPDLYGMDYLFATVMFANPLCWMEMCHLSDSDSEVLAGITSVWNRYRYEFAACDVTPVGECPDGLCFTGFMAAGRERSFLLLFRENGEDSICDFDLGLDGDKKLEVLYGTGDASVEQRGSSVRFTAPEKRSFILVSAE